MSRCVEVLQGSGGSAATVSCREMALGTSLCCSVGDGDIGVGDLSMAVAVCVILGYVGCIVRWKWWLVLMLGLAIWVCSLLMLKVLAVATGTDSAWCLLLVMWMCVGVLLIDIGLPVDNVSAHLLLVFERPARLRARSV